MGKFKIVDGLELRGISNADQANLMQYNTSTGEVTFGDGDRFRNPSIGLDAPSGASFVGFDVDIANSDANWNIQALLSSDPTSAGQAMVNSANPASVTRAAFWKIANNGVNMTAPLTQLSTSSSLFLDRSSGNTGLYRIVGKTVSPNVVSYNLVYLSNAAGNFVVGGPMRIVTSIGVFERSLSPGYNYLSINNSGEVGDKIRFRYEAATGAFPDGGGYIPYEIYNSGNEGFDVEYIVNLANYNFAEGNGFTGTISGISPNIKTLVSNLSPGERLIGSFMVWGEGQNEGLIPQHWARITTNGTVLYGPQ